MTVPSGRSVVAARGRGNWKAMKTAATKPRPGGAGSIYTAADGASRRYDADSWFATVYCPAD
jgi:hypothetical protein